MTTRNPGLKRRLRRIRRQVDQIVADQDPPTLILSPPPLELWHAQRPLAAPVDDERQQSFDFAQRVGAIMLARGASVDDVEASVRAAAMALGLPRPEVDVTFTQLSMSYQADPEHRLGAAGSQPSPADIGRRGASAQRRPRTAARDP